MNSKDRREMVELLRRHQGFSKAAALQEIAQLDPSVLQRNLAALRHVEQKRLKAEQGSTVVEPSLQDHGGPVERDRGGSFSKDSTSRTKKVPYTLLLPPTMLEELKALSEEDGAPVSHHIRQAIKRYLGRTRTTRPW